LRAPGRDRRPGSRGHAESVPVANDATAL
jgi:hypothetical protein